MLNGNVHTEIRQGIIPLTVLLGCKEMYWAPKLLKYVSLAFSLAYFHCCIHCLMKNKMPMPLHFMDLSTDSNYRSRLRQKAAQVPMREIHLS